jgi:CubicO group peptidase (beta-lactamase class C family)
MSNFPALSQLTVIRHGVQIFHRENPQPRESSKSVIFRRLVASWGSIFKCPQETYLDQIQLRWNISSAAKSVTSIMVGIALADGVLAHLDHNVAELLPEHFADVSEPAKCQITLRHLLTMTSGLRSVEGGLYAFRMLASRDWSRFMADLPLDHQPGDCFTYNSANPHLFSAVLAKATGKDLLTYAQERLFDPLGITKVSWGAGPEGLAFGGGNLYLS